ncbi:acyl-CoA carboxylase subunit epsilon [Glycomyces buryatensis]|uniref:Acyl-CoA carboxylase subunit epsilon n=1 Tax=Glycomyces buryatensis TaxID=2570927 RepID=A0A4S8QIP5_9ACTN|nr:acyl-CoA carboxylase subunit epsilon [Glycomyces buryatensis]THV43132.1 acyl-CoA carboxylase subunit epsilon [Glycomyces buryatensis]
MSLELKVVRGNPTDEELAVLVGLITALPREEEENGGPHGRRRANWTNPGLRLRVRRTWRDSAVPARKGMDR